VRKEKNLFGIQPPSPRHPRAPKAQYARKKGEDVHPSNQQKSKKEKAKLSPF
jgi:hypothetical protein